MSYRPFPLPSLSAPRRAAGLLCVLAATTLAVALPARAAAPLNTDDPGVLDAGQCELEPYLGALRAGSPSTRTLTVQAGCGVGAGTQLGLGVLASRTDGDRSGDLFAAGKTTLLAATDARAVSWTLGYGVYAHRDDRRTRGGGGSLLLIGGWSPRPGTDLLLNLGHVHDRLAHRRTTAWGLAAEQAVAASWTVVAEAYGDDRDTPWWNAGLRWQASDRLVVGLAWARSWRTASDRALSVGFTLSR